jgi:D-arabinose 1-dehydrogenase-like Zn-dependent alcohol dehydrogenase
MPFMSAAASKPLGVRLARNKSTKGLLMDALVLAAPLRVELKRMPRPVLIEPTDVIVRVELAGLCGSDLHPFRGDETGCDLGATIMGHECVRGVPLVSRMCS